MKLANKRYSVKISSEDKFMKYHIILEYDIEKERVRLETNLPRGGIELLLLEMMQHNTDIADEVVNAVISFAKKQDNGREE